MRARGTSAGGSLRRLSTMLLLVGAFALLVGAVALVAAGYGAAGYEPVVGRVLRVDVSKDVAYSEHRGDGPRLSDTTLYRPVVEYEYEVGGRRYTADRVDVGSTMGDVAWARERAGEWSPGQEVTVWHDPEEPGRAALDLSAPLAGKVVAALGVALLAAGGVTWRFAAGRGEPRR